MMIKLLIVYSLAEMFEWFSTWHSLAKQDMKTYEKHINISGMCLSYLLTIILGCLGIYWCNAIHNIWLFILILFLAYWIRDIIAGLLTKLFMIFQYREFRKYQLHKMQNDLNNEMKE